LAAPPTNVPPLLWVRNPLHPPRTTAADFARRTKQLSETYPFDNSMPPSCTPLSFRVETQEPTLVPSTQQRQRQPAFPPLLTPPLFPCFVAALAKTRQSLNGFRPSSKPGFERFHKMLSPHVRPRRCGLPLFACAHMLDIGAAWSAFASTRRCVGDLFSRTCFLIFLYNFIPTWRRPKYE
jgi:hypothetical protein